MSLRNESYQHMRSCGGWKVKKNGVIQSTEAVR